MSKADLSQVIFEPGAATDIAMAQIAKMQRADRHRTLPSHVPIVDEYFAPMTGGMLCSVIARPSNCKSLFMRSWAHGLARHLFDCGRDESILFISVEDLLETQINYLIAEQFNIPIAEHNARSIRAGGGGLLPTMSPAAIGRGDVSIEKLTDAATQIGQLPIVRVSDRIGRQSNRKLLTVQGIRAAIMHWRDGASHPKDEPRKIAAVFVDYLQAIPSGLRADRRLQVDRDVQDLRDIGVELDCPVVLAVQAKTGEKGRQPNENSGLETAGITQRSDRIITLWLPAQDFNIGDRVGIAPVQHGRKVQRAAGSMMDFLVYSNLLFVKVAKQRDGAGPSGAVFPCQVDFSTNRITAMPEGWNN